MVFFHKSFDVTPQKAQLMMKQEDIYLLDVRTLEEYQEGHIPHAHLISLSELPNKMQIIPKNLTIFVYCRSGQRANKAKKLLLNAGYQNVYNIGGVMKWPYPLEM